MTRRHNHDSLTEDSINILIEHGLAEGLPRIAEMLLNAADDLLTSGQIPSSLAKNEPAMPMA